MSISGPAGASIYYTIDGSTPDASGPLYSAPFSLSNSATVKAVAIKDGVSSSVASKVFTKTAGSGNNNNEPQSGEVAAPVITSSIDEMAGPEVTITGPQGADIYYTVNGSTPTAESTHYTRVFSMGSGTTIKAIAILNGVSSAVTTYVIPSGDEPLNPDDH